jgi:ACR3 family arsenite efflux pump ArsB
MAHNEKTLIYLRVMFINSDCIWGLLRQSWKISTWFRKTERTDRLANLIMMICSMCNIDVQHIKRICRKFESLIRSTKFNWIHHKIIGEKMRFSIQLFWNLKPFAPHYQSRCIVVLLVLFVAPYCLYSASLPVVYFLWNGLKNIFYFFLQNWNIFLWMILLWFLTLVMYSHIEKHRHGSSYKYPAFFW